MSCILLKDRRKGRKGGREGRERERGKVGRKEGKQTKAGTYLHRLLLAEDRKILNTTVFKFCHFNMICTSGESKFIIKLRAVSPYKNTSANQ